VLSGEYVEYQRCPPGCGVGVWGLDVCVRQICLRPVSRDTQAVWLIRVKGLWTVSVLLGFRPWRDPPQVLVRGSLCQRPRGRWLVVGFSPA